MVAEVVERCYGGGGGGGDQEQALLRRACVFPRSLACCYQNRNCLAGERTSQGPAHSLGSESRAFKYIVPLYSRNISYSTLHHFDFNLVASFNLVAYVKM